MYPELNYEDFAAWYQFQNRRKDDLASKCRTFAAADSIRYAKKMKSADVRLLAIISPAAFKQYLAEF